MFIILIYSDNGKENDPVRGRKIIALGGAQG
jgi:hypothetical protein